MITAKINNISVIVEEGTTILDAALKAQVKIPTLCKHPALEPTASCGLCIVKIKGNNKLLRACCTPIEDGMEITTHNPEIVSVRRDVLELILSKHPNECLTCGRNNNCELQTLAADFGIREDFFGNIVPDMPKDDSTKTIVLDPRKCISCGRCVQVCQDIQDVWALSFVSRGFDTVMAPAGGISLAESPCVKCGQCSAHCPTGAIFEFDDTDKVWEAIRQTHKHCVVQIAPAVRVAIGEAFDFEPGTNLTKKLYAALRRMGFDTIFDTNFGADVTIMEEASEFIERFANGKGELPLITSCCPAWVDFMEKYHGDMVDHFSTCKSPHQIVGVLTKTYYAEKMGIDPNDIFMVSIMPCTAKKYEITRKDSMYSSGIQDIDVSLTTRELSRMIKQAGICFRNLPNERADSILGDYSGAGTIFGVTGGVMEAALRTAHHMITKEELGNVEFHNVRGFKGIKETSIEVAGMTVRIAVAHGLSNVRHVLNKVKKAKENNEELPYHFIEVMACPNGCIGGGGQPYAKDKDIIKKRAEAIYEDDQAAEFRCSHKNPHVIKLYEDFLKKPLSEKSEELLHTKYQDLPVYKK